MLNARFNGIMITTQSRFCLMSATQPAPFLAPVGNATSATQPFAALSTLFRKSGGRFVR